MRTLTGRRASGVGANTRSALTAVVSTVTPAAITLASAIAYVAISATGNLDEPLPEGAPPAVHAALVAAQALALLARGRAPLVVFAIVVALDLAVLATSEGDLGNGSFAVIVSAYTLARHARRRVSLVALGAGAVATSTVGTVAMLATSGDLLEALLTAGTRIAVLYVLPAAVAEYLAGRARLGDALRDQAEMAERERLDRAEREVHAERAALARELHDIAGHHLSGIIVSAQAASAQSRSDPEAARATLQTLQQNARTALADLRRTVGLLRDDDSGGSAALAPTASPSIEQIETLVLEARARGQNVDHVTTGTPRALGPLAETAAYRTVQESLANAARHAPGDETVVHVTFDSDAVRVVVRNGAATASAGVSEVAAGDTATGDDGDRPRYGLAGMEERAILIGATLTTGPDSAGGWRNELVVPLGDARPAIDVRPTDDISTTASDRPTADVSPTADSDGRA